MWLEDDTLVVLGHGLAMDAIDRLAVIDRVEACGGSLVVRCAVEFGQLGDAQIFAIRPSNTDRGVAVLAVWVTETGCLDDVDLLRIQQTRAVRGRRPMSVKRNRCSIDVRVWRADRRPGFGHGRRLPLPSTNRCGARCAC